MNQLKMCANLATHFKIKIIQFHDQLEIQFLKILMNEGKQMPKKFFFIPLFLQFDENTQMEYVHQFIQSVEEFNGSSLFRKGVTVHIHENINSG